MVAKTDYKSTSNQAVESISEPDSTKGKGKKKKTLIWKSKINR